MSKPILIGSLVAATAAGAIIACGTIATNNGPSLTGAAVQSIEITGPGTIAPGQSAQFQATAHLSDGTVKVVAPGASTHWTTSDQSVATVTSSGVVAAQQKLSDTVLSLAVTVGTRSFSASREVIVLPDGTFRLVGKVTDALAPIFPIPGARVAVTPGSLVATTGADGTYRLYGVPPTGTITVSSDSYQPISQPLQISSNATVNFAMTFNGTPLVVARNYSVSIDAVKACSLPTDLQHRTYSASVTQTGLQIDFTLTEARFRTNSIGNGNHFTGHITGQTMTVTVQDYGSYYYSYYGPTAYPSIAERLSDGTYLVPAGTFVLSPSGASFTGQAAFSDLTRWDSKFPLGAFLQGCFSNSLLSMTVTPQ